MIYPLAHSWQYAYMKPALLAAGRGIESRYLAFNQRHECTKSRVMVTAVLQIYSMQLQAGQPQNDHDEQQAAVKRTVNINSLTFFS